MSLDDRVAVTMVLLILCTMFAKAQIACTLCADADAIPMDPSAIFQFRGTVQSCQFFFDQGLFFISVDECSFFQSVGDQFCQCAIPSTAPPPTNPPTPMPTNPPTPMPTPSPTPLPTTLPPTPKPTMAPTINECTLCEDGSDIPTPGLEALPFRNCSVLQKIARQEDSSRCIIWQQTVGVRCGCSNPIQDGLCLICGTFPVVDPNLFPAGLSGLSCGELEMRANMPGLSCSMFQKQYSSECCGTPVTASPTADPGGAIDRTTNGGSIATTTQNTCTPLLLIFVVSVWYILNS